MASNPLDHPQQSFCLKVAGLMGGLGHLPRVCLRGHSLLTSADEGRRCREWPTWASVWSRDSPRSQGFGATGWGRRPSIALSLKRAEQGRQRLKGREEVGSALAAPLADRGHLCRIVPRSHACGLGLRAWLGVVPHTVVFKVCSDGSRGGDFEPSCFPSVKWVIPPACRKGGDKAAAEPRKTRVAPAGTRASGPAEESDPSLPGHHRHFFQSGDNPTGNNKS